MGYLRASLFVVIVLFLVGVLAGVAGGSIREEVVRAVARELRPIAESLAVDPLAAVLLIFLNNLRVALIAFLTGPTLVLPLAITFINGYIVGMFLEYGPRPLLVNLMLILPHGVLEIPAILLSASLGTSLALAAVRKYLFRADVSLSGLLAKHARYLPVVALLLAAAAFIEVYVTLLLYRVVGR